MRKQRFPFLINPYEKPVESPAEDSKEDTGPLLEAESSFRELREAIDALSRMVAPVAQKLGEMATPEDGQNLNVGDDPFYSQLIPVLDGLDSVRESIGASGDESWQKGIDLFYEKLHQLLETKGFKGSVKVGDEFDPSLHEALGAEVSSNVPAGAVSQIVQNGWVLGDRVLRYAKVIVAKRGE